MRGISKAFPGIQALDSASLRVARGEVHGLVGENGAGKSTLIKVLAGVHAAQSGAVIVNGTPLANISPQAVRKAGVRFIHQELSLVPHFTVTESVFLGQELGGPLGLDRRGMSRRASDFLAGTLQADIPGSALIRDLGVAERKLVQIARALIDEQAGLVVFDEPTAPLSSSEIDRLFAAIGKLRERGISIVYVSHYLGEITSVCDSVTVLRNGTDVARFATDDEDAPGRMIRLMLGRELDAMFPGKSHRTADPVLEVEALAGDKFTDVSLSVGEGEIVGLAGLIGSGREELIDTLYGLRKPTSGSVRLGGADARFASPAQAVERGVVLVPRDRRNDGLLLGMSTADNINLASLEQIAVLCLEKRGLAARRAGNLAEKLDIRPRDTGIVARKLSGGNQQKVVLARWLACAARLFILEDPTAGVDIGAKVEIYRLLESLARGGAGVIVSSSDPGELVGICDRIVVMLRGEAVADAVTDGLSQDGLVAMITGGAQHRTGKLAA